MSLRHHAAALVLILFAAPAFPAAAQQAVGSGRDVGTGPVTPAYLLVMGSPTNAEAMGRYARTLPPIYREFGGSYVALGGVGRGLKVLEGDFPWQSLVLASFTDPRGPNRFWWSPQYRASVEIRRGAGTFNVVTLPGISGNGDRPAGRPAYLITIAAANDPAQARQQAAAVLPLLRATDARLIAGGRREDIELLEGEFGNLAIDVLQFPSMAALERFHADPAYREQAALRRQASVYTVLAIEGFVPPNGPPATE